MNGNGNRPQGRAAFEKAFVIPDGCENQVEERLAGLAHEMWAGWMTYLFSKCGSRDDGSAVMPAWAVERWQRQAATPYADLTDDEKDSDRREADRMIAMGGERGSAMSVNLPMKYTTIYHYPQKVGGVWMELIDMADPLTHGVGQTFVEYGDYPVFADMPSRVKAENTRVSWETWWVARALNPEVSLRDFRVCQSKLAKVEKEAQEQKRQLENANRWSSVQDEARRYWMQRAREAEPEREKARWWANKFYGVSLALRKMVTGSDEPIDQSEPEPPGWEERLQYILDTTVRGFKEIALDKWVACISLILEALDSKCENKTAFRAVITGVRDDIDHRLQYGRW